MKMTRWTKVMLPISLFSIMILMGSCGIADQVFNTNFLVNIGGEQGTAQQQITPNLAQYLVLKVANQTNYVAFVTIQIKRGAGDEFFQIPVQPNQTVGKLLENCDSATNPVLSLFVPLLTGSSTGAQDSPLPVAQAYVTVAGLPVVIPSSELPGTLNVRDHFNCGDTVEFVVSTSFTDVNRYRISALVYQGTLPQ